MRVRLDEDMNFTAREADGKETRYCVLFTVEREEDAWDYIVYTEEKIPLFRKERIYASRFRWSGLDLLLTPLATREEADLLRKAHEALDAELEAEDRADRWKTLRAWKEKLLSGAGKGDDTP